MCINISIVLSLLKFQIPNRNSMSFRANLKNFVKLNDFFHSAQLLRYEKENDYRTFTGGLISLIIIVVITVGFAQMIISTFNLTTISYTLKIQKKTNPEPVSVLPGSDQNFMFGIQLNSFFGIYNLSDPIRYLDIQMAYYETQYGKLVNYKNMDLQMCSEKHWREVSPNYDNFSKLKVSNWLCPKFGQNLTTYGKYSSDRVGGFQVMGSPCKNGTDPQKICASPEEIENFFASNNNRLFISLFYTNTIINADNPNYLTVYLEDTAYITFNQKFGVQSYLSFSDYAIVKYLTVESKVRIMKKRLVLRTFLQNQIFSIVKNIRKEVKWERMQSISLYQGEILEQLDVKLLLKRLIFFQFCLKHIFEDYQLEQLEYNLPFRPEQIKSIRRRLEDPIDSKADSQQKSLRMQISSKIVEEEGKQQKSQVEKKDIKNEKIIVEQLKENQMSPFEKSESDQEKELKKGIRNFLRLHQSVQRGDKISQRILQTSIRNLKKKQQKAVQTQSENLNINKQQSIEVCLEIPVFRQQKRKISFILK